MSAAAMARALQADGLTDPVAVPTVAPTLSWKVSVGGDIDGFRVRRAAHVDGLESAVALSVRHNVTAWPGEPLADGEVAFWQVATVKNGESRWSEVARVESPVRDLGGAAAITHPAWVSPIEWVPLPELRTVISVDSSVVSARLAFTSNGVVEPLIDGATAISGRLEPGYAQPGGETSAVGWDVTNALRVGSHEVLLRVGSGMAFLTKSSGRYSKYRRIGEPLWVRAAVHLWHVDGGLETIVTDASWETRLGETAVSHWYGGEEYDSSGATGWRDAVIVEAPEHAWRWAPPIKATANLSTTCIATHGDRRVFDAGLNCAGRPRVIFESPSEGRATVTPGEVLTEGGDIDQSTTGGPIYDVVNFSAGMTEWAPSFGYHGARYFALDGAPECSLLEVEVMRTSNDPVQTFRTSHAFIERLHAMIDRAVQSNMYSVFTDCPHREKLGWLEQLHLCFDAITRGYDAKAHLTDAVRHMVAAQSPNGLIPSIAPEHVVFDFDAYQGDRTAFRDDPNWGRAILDVPWLLYRHYGDTTAIELAWDSGQRYLEYLASRSTDNLLSHGLGDWVMLDESVPVGMVGSWGYGRAVETASRIAAALGKPDEQARYKTLAAKIWAAWRERYFDAETGIWGSGSQASWALAHDAPVNSPTERDEIYTHLLESIRAAGEAFTIGEIALTPLIEALTDHGDGDLLLRILQRPDVPGYGMQLANDATALTESWEAANGTAGVVSQNHFMLGAIDSWILGHVAGLRQHPDDIGWRHVVIDPLELEEVDDASLRFDSPYGTYTVSWRRGADGRREIVYTAPAGAVVDVAS